MLILFLFFCFLPSQGLGSEDQISLTPDSGRETKDSRDLASGAVSCEEILNRAVSLNESFKNSISAGGRRAFGLEVEKYLEAVVLEKLPGCVTHAIANSDVALSRRLFEFAYSYSNSNDKEIDLEFARLYSKDQEIAKTILLDYEYSKRQELIEMLKRGLDKLYCDNAQEASRLKELRQSLDTLDSK